MLLCSPRSAAGDIGDLAVAEARSGAAAARRRGELLNADDVDIERTGRGLLHQPSAIVCVGPVLKHRAGEGFSFHLVSATNSDLAGSATSAKDVNVV